MQDLLHREMQACINIPVSQLAEMSLYFSKLEFTCRIIETLPREIASYKAFQQPETVTIEQLVRHVAEHYGISEVNASHFLKAVGKY